MKTKILLISLFLIPFALFSQKKKTTGIVYENMEASIILNHDGTFVYIVNHCDICPSFGESDTVSYGRYVKRKKSYYLFSSPEIWGAKMETFADEKMIETSDSLTIELFSPFEMETLNNPNLRTTVFYQIEIYYDADSVRKLIGNQDSVLLSRFKIYFDDLNSHRCHSLPQTIWYNKLTIYKPANFPVSHIEIKIYPTVNYRVNRFFLWSMYSLKNPYSNHLQIHIPHFTYQYFCYEYFHYKEVEIISSKVVGMDGCLFWESDSFKKLKTSHRKRHVNWRYRLWEINHPYEEDEEY